VKAKVLWGTGDIIDRASKASIGLDQVIGPPFTLHRQRGECCTRLIGTVGGQRQRFITSITARQTILFDDLMAAVLEEAQAGAFTTKGDANNRRDQILAVSLAAAARAVRRQHGLTQPTG